MAIKSFDKPVLRMLTQELLDDLKAFEKRHGIKIEYKGASYSNNNATMKLELQTVDASGVAQSKEKAAFAMYAKSFGLAQTDLGKCFSVRGERFTITGLSPRRHKFPIDATRIADGRTYKFDVDSVKGALLRTTAAAMKK